MDNKEKSKKKKKDKIDVSISMDKESKEYKEYYYDMERYLMDNCSAIKEKIASNEVEKKHSVSENEEALILYTLGTEESKKNNYKKAAEYYEKALKIDSIFSFAWDNLGVTYRRLEDYDKAIYAYNKSLELDSTGVTPLQNIAVVYLYKKEYEKAIDAYKKLAKIQPENSEVFYGIGNIELNYLNNYESGLDNMCKAYNLYISQNSPYRTDAERAIQFAYKQMKEAGKEKQFFDILSKNNISPNKK